MEPKCVHTIPQNLIETQRTPLLTVLPATGAHTCLGLQGAALVSQVSSKYQPFMVNLTLGRARSSEYSGWGQAVVLLFDRNCYKQLINVG